MPTTVRTRVRWTTGALAVALALAGLVGCTDGDGGATPSPSASEGASPTAAPDAELPDHAGGRQAAWVLAQLAPGAEPTEDDVTERFAPAFLEQLPPAQVLEVLAQLRDEGPWTVASVQDHAPVAVVVLLEGPAARYEMQLVVDADERVETLFFGEPPPERDPAASWDELVEEVASSRASTSLHVARVVDGACVPLEGMPAGTAAGESLPMGSMIKLWVLGAVVDAVARGDLAWDDEVTVTDELRSLPTGRLQDEPAGTTVTVREAAELMVSISDNTATDLLLDAVGREAVEAALAGMGHADPAANVPLLTTRELFAVGWSQGGELRRRWRDGDAQARRALLAEVPPGQPDVDPVEMAQVPAWADGVDWFGTAEDVCAAHAALAGRAATPAGEPVREILALNPGVGPVEGYDHVGYKGGSSVGTMAGSWYAEPSDGTDPVVVVLQTATRSLQHAVRGEAMVGIAEDALRLARDAS